MPKPARARTFRGLMADDDEPPAASSSALHSAVEESAGASVPPLRRAAGNVSPTPAEVLAVAVEVDTDDLPHRSMPQRRSTPAELLIMLERYDAENPELHCRLDVMNTCIAAAFPDAVVGDARYQSAIKWFRRLEANQAGDESSGGVLSDASKRTAALVRMQAEVALGKKKVADALAKKEIAEVRALVAARKVAETEEKRATKAALEHDRRLRAENAHAAAAAAPHEMPRAMGVGRKGIAAGEAEEDEREEQPRSAPYRTKPRVKQLPYHVEIMGGPAGRNETEAGDLTSMTRTRKRALCWRGLRVLQEWAQSIINEWVAGGCDAKAPPQVIAVQCTVHSSQFIVHSSQSVMTVNCVHSS